MNKLTKIVSVVLIAAMTASPLEAQIKKAKSPPPTLSGWQVVTHNSFNYSYKAATNDYGNLVTQFTSGGPYNVFFIKPCTNLTGKTLMASMAVDGALSYWGAGTSSNPCYGTPPSFRLVFWSNTKFSLSDSSQAQYWYSNPINGALTNTVETLIESIDSLNWSDGLGRKASDPAYTASFLLAARNAKMYGVCLYGGCFFDVGVYGKPSATIRLLDFNVN